MNALYQYSFANIAQKLSFIGIVALLATAATATPIEAPVEVAAADWECGRSDGGGDVILKRLHTQFNKLFGAPRLTMARGQCYIVDCYGHYFGICNLDSTSRTEISGDRNVAGKANPESGSICTIYPSDRRLRYHYGRNNYPTYFKNTDLRRC
ncbi:hypothetical protein EMCG_04318 [[Emmonsia] crescens]|uniref:Uncharacterized protein n=1 Tax=[Emmonsia] crescens TaxID=73230 RepID=A0A0G2IZ25_9EURO|nr:hypothetical protein EMCG_04318 [Emmonsia crescens UAMH 3008]